MGVKGVLFAAMVLGAAPAAAQTMAPPGASSCSGCHPRAGAADAPVLSLHGREANEIIAAMQAFRTGERSATVMDRIAKGYSDDEVRAIAAWLGAQR